MRRRAKLMPAWKRQEQPPGLASPHHCGSTAREGPRPSRQIWTLAGSTETTLQGVMPEQLLGPREFLDECIAFKQSQPGAGRFFATLARGELPRDLLTLWAKDMYHFIQPGIPALTAWLSHA